MARKSRKNNIKLQLDNKQKVFKTAIYARLSTKKSESFTIKNQISYCKNYVNNKNNNNNNNTLELVDIYIDDGVSGTTFNRVGFNDLMQGIYENKIDCVIVREFCDVIRINFPQID